MALDPSADDPVFAVFNQHVKHGHRGFITHRVLETPRRNGVRAVRVHQSDPFQPRHVVAIFLIEQVKVFITETNTERLRVAWPNVNIGQDRDGA